MSDLLRIGWNDDDIMEAQRDGWMIATSGNFVPFTSTWDKLHPDEPLPQGVIFTQRLNAQRNFMRDYISRRAMNGEVFYQRALTEAAIRKMKR